MAELQLTVRLQKYSALYNSITYINVEGFSTIDTWLAFCPLPFRDDHTYKSCTTKKLESYLISFRIGILVFSARHEMPPSPQRGVWATTFGSEVSPTPVLGLFRSVPFMCSVGVCTGPKGQSDGCNTPFNATQPFNEESYAFFF